MIEKKILKKKVVRKKNNKIKILDYMIAISFMITHGSIDSAGL